MKNKKRLAAIISAVILAVLVLSIGTFSYAYDVAKKNSIGIDKALNIALNDAGITEENAAVTKAKMGFEKNVFVYDIEFVENGIVEYDYTIKASDGTILEKSHEIDKDDDDRINNQHIPESTTQAAKENVSESTQNTSGKDKTTTLKNNTDTSIEQTSKNSSKNISLEEAKTIALKNAGVAKKDASFTSAHKDYDDGITYYDIEFRTSSYEYEYEIDLNGKILSVDKDPLKTKNKKTTTAKESKSGKYIGVDSAKKIALKSSGHSAGDVVFTKAKLEKDDGIYVYEIEFKTSTTEYEYEINATTGKIIEKSAEPIDD